jgi:DNA-directed RNA polymerase subunit RPC12/RpoP
MTREEQLETIVKVFAKIMFYGDWEWGTPNERVITMLMQEVGMYPFKNEDDMISKTPVSDELYKKAIKEVPSRQTKGGNEWWKGNLTVAVPNDDLVPYHTICGCNPANGGNGVCGCIMANQMVRKGGTTTTTTSTNTGLVSLDEHNSNAWSTQVNMYSGEPRPNGIACPECGNELMDTNPMMTLTSHPAKKDVHCPKCEYKGYRIV